MGRISTLLGASIKECSRLLYSSYRGMLHGTDLFSGGFSGFLVFWFDFKVSCGSHGMGFCPGHSLGFTDRPSDTRFLWLHVMLDGTKQAWG